MTNLRIIPAESVSPEEALILAKFVNTLPETSVLREALAYALDSLMRDKNVYMFFYPAGEEIEPDDTDGES